MVITTANDGIMRTMYIDSDDDCLDLIERYGKQIVKKLFYYDMIKYAIPDDKVLLGYGFKQKYLSVVRSHIKRGKSVTHLNKCNGNVKKQFRGHDFCSIVDATEAKQKEKNMIILLRLSEMFYEAYVRRYRKQFIGVNIDTDPITCDDIIDAVYIKPDWDNNCKVVYSLDTLTKCRAYKRENVGFSVNSEGEDVYCYREVCLGYFVSPYTKAKFHSSDVKLVHINLLKT
jgi:hypothetical protein